MPFLTLYKEVAKQRTTIIFIPHYFFFVFGKIPTKYQENLFVFILLYNKKTTPFQESLQI